MSEEQLQRRQQRAKKRREAAQEKREKDKVLNIEFHNGLLKHPKYHYKIMWV